MSKQEDQAKEALNKKKPDFYVKVKLSSFEAALVYHLREHDFGHFEVIKQYGQPRKVMKIGSEILKESDAYKLGIEEMTQQGDSELFADDENGEVIIPTAHGKE